MNIAVLLSGGKGERMGLAIPKQYVRVAGKMLVTYCLETLCAHPLVDAVQIVAEDEWKESILCDAEAEGIGTEKIRGFSKPGESRQESVFHALEDIKVYGDWLDVHKGLTVNGILIHDAVRPHVSGGQVTACFRALKDHDGAMPVLPMKDTVYLSGGDGRISGLLDRERVVAGQAPEAFVFSKYYEANLLLLPDDIHKMNGSTEPAVMAGMDVVMIPGDEDNYKITTKADLERFKEQKGASYG